MDIWLLVKHPIPDVILLYSLLNLHSSGKASLLLGEEVSGAASIPVHPEGVQWMGGHDSVQATRVHQLQTWETVVSLRAQEHRHAKTGNFNPTAVNSILSN